MPKTTIETPEDEPKEEEKVSYESCPICGGEGYSIGTLGKKIWYRCRHCGTDFSA